MRSSLFVVVPLFLVACGVFGSTSDAPTTESPEPQAGPSEADKAAANARLPVGGPAADGIFVSSSKGDDMGTGAMDNPVKSLALAFALAKERGTRVVACAEDFRESVTLVDGVSVFGSYNCNQTPWKEGKKRTRLLAPTSPAVTARGLSLATRLDAFEVVAPDLDSAPATDQVATSTALDVRASHGLIVSQSVLHAGKGAPGSDGVVGRTNSRTASSNGLDATDETQKPCSVILNPHNLHFCRHWPVEGPAGGVTSCATGPAGGPGGKGGDGRFWEHGEPAELPFGVHLGKPRVATPETAEGGDYLGRSFGFGSRGGPGSNGKDGADGNDGPNGAGLFSAEGFLRGNGTAGDSGKPGQGGGGGSGTANFYETAPDDYNEGPRFRFPAADKDEQSATGGGGGAGGCGGQSGSAGTGGGASIGALLIQSVVTLESTRIESDAGGRAGKGNLGTMGTDGGKGGRGTTRGENLQYRLYSSVTVTGAGGNGGAGGAGGSSGHGAPGPSIALAYSTQPTMVDLELVPGAAGAGQPELKSSVAGPFGAKVLPAVVGESKAQFGFQL